MRHPVIEMQIDRTARVQKLVTAAQDAFEPCKIVRFVELVLIQNDGLRLSALSDLHLERLARPERRIKVDQPDAVFIPRKKRGKRVLRLCQIKGSVAARGMKLLRTINAHTRLRFFFHCTISCIEIQVKMPYLVKEICRHACGRSPVAVDQRLVVINGAGQTAGVEILVEPVHAFHLRGTVDDGGEAHAGVADLLIMPRVRAAGHDVRNARKLREDLADHRFCQPVRVASGVDRLAEIVCVDDLDRKIVFLCKPLDRRIAFRHALMRDVAEVQRQRRFLREHGRYF